MINVSISENNSGYNLKALFQFLKLTLHNFDTRSKFRLFFATFICVVAAVVQMWAPVLVAHGFSSTSSGADKLLVYLALFVGVRFFGQILADLRWILLNPTLYKLTYILSIEIPRLIVGALGTQNFSESKGGELAERNAIVEKTQLSMMSALYQMLVVLIPTFFEVVVVISVLLFTIGAAAAIMIAVGIAAFVVSVIIGQATEARSLSLATQADNQVLARTGEYLGHSFLANQYHCHNFFSKRVGDGIENSLRIHNKFFRIKFARSVARSVAISLSYVIAVLLVAKIDTVGEASIGSIFLLIYYADRIFQPLTSAAVAVTSLRSSLVSISIGRDLIEKITSQNIVSTSVPRMNLPINLKNGSWVRVLGTTGAGKTTLLRSYFNGLPKNVSGDDNFFPLPLYLDANTQLVDGLVFDNLSLGRFTREVVQNTFDRYWELLRSYGSEVSLDTPVVHLSGGERQALAIIRAVLARPQILILDEATSAMDLFVEQNILNKLSDDLDTCVVYFVSHRDPLSAHFDEVFIIEPITPQESVVEASSS